MIYNYIHDYMHDSEVERSERGEVAQPGQHLRINRPNLRFSIDCNLNPIASQRHWKFDLVKNGLTLESEKQLYIGVKSGNRSTGC
jgi:hypothetical protein